MTNEAGFIAVIDDERSVRDALARLLRSDGHVVRTFDSGLEFLRSLSQRQPTCVLLDLRMPVVNGFEIVKALSLARHRIPTVVITGDDSAESRKRALEQGVCAYLSKPVDDVVLLSTIESVIADRSA